MDLVEFNTHSFIVKIWLEEPGGSSSKARWRGHITHVPSGERKYLENLDQISTFIVPYLLLMGVRIGAFRRLLSWVGNGAPNSGPKIGSALSKGAQVSESHGHRPIKG